MVKKSREQHVSHGLLGCAPGTIGRYVLLPGDPDRVPLIAELFEEAREVSRTREFCAYTGTLQGEMVSAVSTAWAAIYGDHSAGLRISARRY